nr:FAD-dependent oxidoreductase [Thiomicrorhabdus sp.]
MGAGYAGWQAAEAIRKEMPDAEITLLTACDGTVYPKPALSMALSQGRAAEDLKEATADEKAAELDIGVKVRTKVMNVNAKRKKVTTTGGSFSYKKLVIATGAKAITPKLDGDAAHEVFTLNDLGSYKKFRAELEGKESVAIIGGGLIGTEMAEDLSHLPLKINLMVRESNLMTSLLPESIALNLRHRMTDKGIDIQFNSEVVEINKAEQGYELIKANGGSVHAGIVLAAVGIRPNIELAKKLDLQTQRGIVINAHCQTSDPDVYAIGDCAERDGVVQAFLEPIRRQAKAIAQHLAGQGEEVFDLVSPLVKTKTPSLSIMVSPPLHSESGEWQVTQEDGLDQELLYSEGDKVTGFALSGNQVSHANQLYQQHILQ